MSWCVNTMVVFFCLLFFVFPISAADRELEVIRDGYLETRSKIKSIDCEIVKNYRGGGNTPRGFPLDKLTAEYNWIQNGEKYRFTSTVSAEGNEIPTLRVKNVCNGQTEWRFIYSSFREPPIYVLKHKATRDLFESSYNSSHVATLLGEIFKQAFEENSPHYLGKLDSNEEWQGIRFIGFKEQSFSGRNYVIDREVWFDTKAGYLPRLFKDYNRTTETEATWEIDELKAIESANGIVWFPVSAKFPDVRNPKQYTEYKVKKVEINSPIPDEKFLPQVPAGIEIVDESNEERVSYYKDLIRKIATDGGANK